MSTQVLDENEQLRHDNFRRSEDRKRFLAGITLAKAAVAERAHLHPAEVSFDRACWYCGDAHGKPLIRESTLFHSVTHSEDVVAVAVTDVAPVGIDAEYRTKAANPVGSSRLFLGPGERPCEAADQFYTVWCRKEAVIKATGRGLATPLSEVVVGSADQVPRLIGYRGEIVNWWMSDLDFGEDYAGAVCVMAPGPVAVSVVDGGELCARMYRGSQ